MKVFYIPDGHRRYADKSGCSLSDAYWKGYEVLINEVIEPLLRADVTHLDVFLLSNLNLTRRDPEELNILLRDGDMLLSRLIDHSRSFASVRTLGNYLPHNVDIRTVPDRVLTLILGCTTGDEIGCSEVDVFLRSGGEIRLSGAPRSIIGNYTQFYGIDKLHPDLLNRDIETCLSHFRSRYMRELQQS
jgi:undecaprenyl pyrophosphate synthase